MNSSERRDELRNALAEINASLLSNSQVLDKAILSLSSAGFGVSLAFIKNVVPLDKATNLYLLHFSWGAFVGAIVFTLISFLTSQYGLEVQAKQIIDELENPDDEQDFTLNEEADDYESINNCKVADPSDKFFHISKWLTLFSLKCYIAAVFLTFMFVVLNGDVIST